MPRTPRLINNDETTVYHDWGVETDPKFAPRFNHILA